MNMKFPIIHLWDLSFNKEFSSGQKLIAFLKYSDILETQLAFGLCNKNKFGSKV